MTKKDHKKDEQQHIDNSATQTLQAQITKLEKQLGDQEEITKRAQSDYMRTKIELDSYIHRTEANKQESKVQSLVDVAKKLLPSVYQLKIMTETCPVEFAENTWAQGVLMVYTKLVKELEILGISPIITVLGSEPNLSYHAPMGTTPTENPEMKGKIVKEIQQGYVYKKGDDEKVIVPATVIVGE